MYLYELTILLAFTGGLFIGSLVMAINYGAFRRLIISIRGEG